MFLVSYLPTFICCLALSLRVAIAINLRWTIIYIVVFVHGHRLRCPSIYIAKHEGVSISVYYGGLPSVSLDLILPRHHYDCQQAQHRKQTRICSRVKGEMRAILNVARRSHCSARAMEIRETVNSNLPGQIGPDCSESGSVTATPERLRI